MRPAQPNQSLIDGLEVLQALAAHAQPIGSRELARMLGLEPTRANRLLKTLAYVGLAQQDADRKYLPGPGVHVLAAQAMRGSGLLRRALGPLDALLERRGEEMLVSMGVLWRDQMAYLYHASADEGRGRALGREPLYPAEHSGLGHALLAALPDDQVAARFDGRDDVDLAGLLRSLARVRSQGYALVETPEARHAHTLAIAFDDAAAIGLAGSFGAAEVPALLAELRATADAINGANGQVPPHPGGL